MSVGERIKTIRRNAGMSQEELAIRLNDIYGTKIVKGMISKWENDKDEPSMKFIRNIANFFSVSLDYLLEISDVNNSADNIVGKISSNSDLKKLFELASKLNKDDLKTILSIAERFSCK